jgi:KDO2-lipid IV(A) lauroyltransferase
MMATSFKNGALHVVFEALVSLGMAMPPAAARAVGGLLGRAAHVLPSRERRTARENLADSYEEVFGLGGEPPEIRGRRIRQTVRKLFVNLGRWAGEMCSYVQRPGAIGRRAVLTARSESNLREALSKGRGVLYLTGHLGHWELMACALAARGLPITAVGRGSYHPGITDLQGWLRSRAGVDLILRDEPGAPRRLLGALARGRIVGVFVDQSTSLPSRPVDFLGRPAPTIEAPARLALRHRGSVVFGSCHEAGSGRLHIEVDPVIIPDGAGLGETLEVINRHVEQAVRAFPDQWVWMHERWRKRST